MPRLKWDQLGEHFYETGVSNMVLFPFNSATSTYAKGVAWNGVTGFTESPSGAEANPFYADNQKYLNLISAEEFGGTLTAYTYPDEFKECNGYAEIAPGVTIGQQVRKPFGLAYKTLIGNDTEQTNKGYKIKLVYGCQAAPSEQSHSTVNESPEPTEMSWEVSTTPIEVPGYKVTATLDIDSTKVDADKLAALLNIIWGTDGTISYSAATDTTGKNPVNEGWYERSGSAGAYVYTPTTDTTVDSSKTYYVKTETGGTDARLPLPKEVAELVGVAEG